MVVISEVNDYLKVGTYIGIPQSSVKQILSRLRIPERFSSGDSFSQYLRSLFNDYWIFSDNYYWWDTSLQPVMHTIFDSWRAMVKYGGFRYHLEADCDDFANAFAAFTSLKFGTNVALRVWGMLCFRGSSSQYGFECQAHAWNLVLVLWETPRRTVIVSPIYVEPQLPRAGAPDEFGVWETQLDNYFLRYVPYIAFG